MPRASKCIRVAKKDGQETLALARRRRIVDADLEIERDKHFIYIPILKESADCLKAIDEQVSNVKLCERLFPERKKRETSLAHQLEHDMSPELLESLPHAMDFIGNIAVIEMPSELDPYKKLVGEAVLRTHKNIQTVLAKAGAVSGIYRLRQFTVIAGEPKTETLHREHGCKYLVDIAKAYFSPRLSSEHTRISKLVQEGETVVDMFAGVGPFAVQIAKTHEKVTVYAIDINSDAISYLNQNVRLNRVEEKVHPILGDARQIVDQKLRHTADRVVMNLPEKAMDYVDVACEAIRPQGGIIHFYRFANAVEPVESILGSFTLAVEKSGRKVVKISSKRVRETAPFESQIVLDAEIR